MTLDRQLVCHNARRQFTDRLHWPCDALTRLPANWTLILACRPIHSNFLVAAVITYLDNTGKLRHITGVNSETCVLASAICAERTALLQLRLQPHGYTKLHSVYVTATADAPISPGLLCREFMQEYGGPDTRIVLITPGWKAADHLGDAMPGLVPAPTQPPAATSVASAASPAEASTASSQQVPLELAESGCCICRLGDLYPCAPIYHRVNRDDLVTTGSAFSRRMQPFDEAAADACIRLALASAQVTASKGPSSQSASSSADGKASGKTEMTEDQLQAKLLLLYQAVKTLAQTENGGDQLYPIHRAAGMLFEDGSHVLAREDKCLEYGCSIDAVSRLSLFIAQSADCGIKPLVLIPTDQFGICTAPAAEPRAWLHEYGYDHVVVPAHVPEQAIASDCGGGVGHAAGCGVSHTHATGSGNGEGAKAGGRLLITTVSSLAPAAPQISLSKR